MCVILWWNKLFYCPCFVLWFLWNCLYALKDSGPGCVAMCAHFPVALDRVWYLNSFISYDTANDTPLWHVGLSALVILTGNYQHTAVHEFCSFFFFFLWVLVSLVIWEALKSLDIASLVNSLIDFFKNSVQTRADIFLNFTINPCLIVKTGEILRLKNTSLTWNCLHNNMSSSSTLTSEAAVWQREETWQLRARVKERRWVQLRWSQRITSQRDGKWQTWNFDKQPHIPKPCRISRSSQYSGGLMDWLMDCWQRARRALPVLNSLLIESDGLAVCKCSWCVPEQKTCKYFTARKA